MCRPAMASALWFSMFSNLSIIVVPLYMFQMFDKVMPSQNMNTLWMLFIAAVFVLLFSAYMDALRGRLMVYVGSWIDKSLGEEALSASFQSALNGSQSFRSSSSDVMKIRNFFSGPSMTVLMDIPWVPLFFVLIFIFNFYIGLVALCSAIILMVLTALQQLWVQPRMAQARQAFGEASALSRGLIENAEAVESMGMRGKIINMWKQKYIRSLALLERSSQSLGSLQAISKSFRLLMMMTIISIAMWQIMNPSPDMSIGLMFGAVILISRILQPVEQGLSKFQELSDVFKAFDNLSDALSNNDPGRTSGMSLPAPKGYLSVENLSVVIPSVGPILRNVSFRLAPGDVLGVVGASAAGKSTLGRALVGIIPPKAGNVRLDGADLWTWDSSNVGRFIGYVPQKITLFDGTISENIARFYRDPNYEDVVRAAKAVGLHDMISKLPDGYETQIGLGNIILSGGQRQRIALARAMFGDPVFIVLDEPNSNLDTDGEKFLLEALKLKKKDGATIVIIAHRPSILQIADKILVMKNGTVQRLGTPEETGLLLSGKRNPNPQMEVE